MYLLYKRIRNLHIPIDLQIQLFNQTILPILLYGCEIWGFQNVKMIERTCTNSFLDLSLDSEKVHRSICFMQS